jgi:putative membrane protein
MVLGAAGALGCGLATAQMNRGMGSSNSQSQIAQNAKMQNAANSGQRDGMFLQSAAQGGMAEVELGKLAQEKSNNQQVKDFGAKMVTDHTKMNDQVKDLAAKMNVNLPTEPTSADRREKAMLEQKSGADFDKAYMSAMVKDHKKDLSDFRSEVASTQNAQVKDLASQGQGVIAEHLKLAEETYKAVLKGQ